MHLQKSKIPDRFNDFFSNRIHVNAFTYDYPLNSIRHRGYLRVARNKGIIVPAIVDQTDLQGLDCGKSRSRRKKRQAWRCFTHHFDCVSSVVILAGGCSREQQCRQCGCQHPSTSGPQCREWCRCVAETRRPVGAFHRATAFLSWRCHRRDACAVSASDSRGADVTRPRSPVDIDRYTPLTRDKYSDSHHAVSFRELLCVADFA